MVNDDDLYSPDSSPLKNSKKRAHNDRLTGSTSFRALFVQLRTTFLSPRGYFTLLYRKHRMCPTNSLLCLLREILEFLQFLLCCSSNSYCFVKTFTKIQKIFPLKWSSLKRIFSSLWSKASVQFCWPGRPFLRKQRHFTRLRFISVKVTSSGKGRGGQHNER